MKCELCKEWTAPIMEWNREKGYGFHLSATAPAG